MTITFKHNYDKLRKRQFTTIRSKAFGAKADKAGWVAVVMPKGCVTAEVMAVDNLKIKDIPFELLVADVAPFEISTRAGFVAFVNSLRDRRWAQATLETEMAIITLGKV